MLLRVRGPQGQATLKVEPEATVADFRALLEEKTGVPAALQEVGAPAWRVLPLVGSAVLQEK